MKEILKILHINTSDSYGGAARNENYDELSKNAREKVIREFDYGVVAKKYISLYEEVL